MRWDAKITDTAKISVEVRWILIDRVDSILNDLRVLRQRAVGYASLESVTVLAAHIPLPPPTASEIEELSDSCAGSFRLLPEINIGEQKEGILEALLRPQQEQETGNVEISSGLEETWYQRLDFLLEDLDTLDPSLCWESVCHEWEDPSNTFVNPTEQDPESDDDDYFWDAKESSPYHSDVQKATWSHHEVAHVDYDDTNGGHTGSIKIDSQSLRPAMREQSLLTPLCESIPEQLKTYLDEIDAAREISFSSFDFSPYEDTPGREGYFEQSTEAGSNPCAIQSTARELLDYLQSTWSPYPISAHQLLELQEYMQQVIRFKTYLVNTLIDVRNSLNRREERYRMRESNGGITAIMKSHGDRSPLVNTMLVDEDWKDEDEWSSTVRRQADCVKIQKFNCKVDQVKW